MTEYVRVHRDPEERHERNVTLLEKYADGYIDDVVALFPGMKRVEALGTKRLADVVTARYLMIAVLYHVCLVGRDREAVRRYLDKRQPMISKALAAVDAASRRKFSSPLRDALVKLCTTYELEVEWFRLK